MNTALNLGKCSNVFSHSLETDFAPLLQWNLTITLVKFRKGVVKCEWLLEDDLNLFGYLGSWNLDENCLFLSYQGSWFLSEPGNSTGREISLLPHPSALPPQVGRLQQRLMFIADNTEHVTPVHCQLLMGWQPLCSESWPGTCWKIFLLYQYPQFPQAFSAVSSERPMNKQPVWTGSFLYPKKELYGSRLKPRDAPWEACIWLPVMLWLCE